MEIQQANQNKGFAGIGLKQLLGSAGSSASEGDPVYSLARDAIPVWPHCISQKKKLFEASYEGGGWALHFRNPSHPMRNVDSDDLRRVLVFLRDTHGFVFLSVIHSTAGTIQADLGSGRGKLQLYSRKLGLPCGNLRIAVGDKQD